MGDVFKAYPTRQVLNGASVVTPSPGGTGTFGYIYEGLGCKSYGNLDVLEAAQSTNGRFLEGSWNSEYDNLVQTASDTNSAVGADAVVNYNAGTYNQNHVIDGVSWSYGSDPSGSISVESPSGTTVWGPLAVTTAGPGFIPFPNGLCGADESSLLVRLKSGGTSVSGTVSVLGHRVR